jgi:chromosome segregation ATPase
MEGILASLVPTLLTAALAWHTTRIRKDRDQLDQQRCEQIKELKARVERHNDQLQAQALEIQAAKAAVGVTTADVEELKKEVREIRDNMVRKDDLVREMEGLRTYIGTALRFTPPNKRR